MKYITDKLYYLRTLKTLAYKVYYNGDLIYYKKPKVQYNLKIYE